MVHRKSSTFGGWLFIFRDMENHYKYYTDPKNPMNTIYGVDDERDAIEWFKVNGKGKVIKTLSDDEEKALEEAGREAEIPDKNKYGQKYHQDFILIDTKGLEWQFEFKSVKHFKTHREDGYFVDEDYNTIFLEFANDYKKKGWLYSWEMKNEKEEFVNPNHMMMFLVKHNKRKAYLFVRTKELCDVFYQIYWYVWEHIQHKSPIISKPKERYRIYTRKCFYDRSKFNSRVMCVSVRDVIKHCKTATLRYLE